MYVLYPNSLCEHEIKVVLNVECKTSPTDLRTTKTSRRTTLLLCGKLVHHVKAKDTNSSSFAIPIIAYGFLGVEIVAMTAYEARDVKDLRRPSRVIAYVVFLSYFFCALGETLNVKWIDSDLPIEYGASNKNGTGSVVLNARSRALVVLAAQHAGYKALPGFLTGCMIFSVLSAANTALYVASRVLFGMTREIRNPNWPYSWLQYFGTVRRSGAPGWALVFSALSFFWLPFLQLKAGYSIQDVSP
jgi:yeast amino acid transporter